MSACTELCSKGKNDVWHPAIKEGEKISYNIIKSQRQFQISIRFCGLLSSVTFGADLWWAGKKVSDATARDRTDVMLSNHVGEQVNIHCRYGPCRVLSQEHVGILLDCQNLSFIKAEDIMIPFDKRENGLEYLLEYIPVTEFA